MFRALVCPSSWARNYTCVSSIVWSSWWWAHKSPKHVEQIISAINHSVASTWFSSLRLYNDARTNIHQIHTVFCQAQSEFFNMLRISFFFKANLIFKWYICRFFLEHKAKIMFWWSGHVISDYVTNDHTVKSPIIRHLPASHHHPTTHLVKQHNSWGWNILHTYSFLVHVTRDMLTTAHAQSVPN